jgi:hypothetical protein
MGWRVNLGFAALAFAATGAVVRACVGGDDEPAWTLVKPQLDPGGNAAMLLPSNDTRVNLLLLLADRRGAAVHDPRAKEVGPPLALFSWVVMSNRAVPPHADFDNSYGTRCQSNGAGQAAFIAAVRASTRVSEEQRHALIRARQMLGSCGTAPLPDAELHALPKVDREFGAYLVAARDFYAGGFDQAAAVFKSLARASDPWVRETAAYMVGRSLINRALADSIDEYGGLALPAKRDARSAAAAGAAFQLYLRAYPRGRYAASARGLMRRVYWLSGDSPALAAEYDRELAIGTALDSTGAVALANEIDNKLPLPAMQPKIAHDPLLLAVVDLHRVRQPESEEARSGCCGPAISRSEIEAQRPLFGNDTDLFDYVRAAHALFIGNRPREVREIIPDAARQARFTYLDFSRQMLRGLALERLSDPNSRAFWLSLFQGAVQPYQREALELALATHDERAGRIDRVFAPGSIVTHPIMRQLLLEHVAGPDLLRRQATRADVPQFEREVALYILLAKELRRGFYGDILRDLALVPADAPRDSWFPGASRYEARYAAVQDRPPLGRFGPKANLGDFGCPSLQRTVSHLLAAPEAVRPRLCLAEFFRVNGFDGFNSDFGFDDPTTSGLGSTRSQFPTGKAFSRLEVYRSVMADPRASPDDRALALNRAVRCYAPVGNNSCGGREVNLSVRRGWYLRLKSDYPNSRWARDLEYYW